MDAEKLMNQRNHIMKHKKITEMEVEEIRRELQESQISHLEEREEETAVFFPVHFFTAVISTHFNIHILIPTCTTV